MPITDLTGTTWEFNDNLINNLDLQSKQWQSLQFISNNQTFVGGLSWDDPNMDYDNIYQYKLTYFGSDNASVYQYINNSWTWTDSAYKTITITGGTDATNSTLIAWLEANGTLTAPIQANTYNLTHTLTNLTKGNITLQITPDTNYTYPTSLTISNGTIVSYDNTTGVAVISGDDTTIVSGECVEQATPIKCIVNGLGSQNPSSVSFTKDAGFTLAGLGIEETTIGTDVFIKIPKMYRKVNTVVDNQITSFTISNTKEDNDYQLYPCFIDESGNELDYVLVGKYYISSTTTANSINATKVDMTIGNGRTLCQAKTDASYQGLQYDWQIHKLWQDLIICFKETVDTSSGSGIGTDGIDDLGIYWGGQGCWADGLTYSSGALAVSYKPSAYVNSATSSTTDYVAISYNNVSASNSANITKLGYDSNHPFVNMPTGASGTSYTTYYCDYLLTKSGNHPFHSFGVFSDNTSGVFATRFYDAWSVSRPCRLCYRPIQ